MMLDQEQASLLSAANISNLESQLSDERHDYQLQLKQVKVDKQEFMIFKRGMKSRDGNNFEDLINNDEFDGLL